MGDDAAAHEQDGLAQGDDEDETVALGQVLGVGVPLVHGGCADTGNPVVGQRGRVVDEHRDQPETQPPLEGQCRTEDPEHAGQQGPQQQHAVVGCELVAAVGDHHEHRTEEAHEQVAPDEEPGAVAEGAGYSDRHAQCGEHEHPGEQLHWGAARIQPVHRPGGVVPAPPHRGEHHDGLGSALPGEVLDEQVRELDDGEDVDQVEEELDRADLGSTVPDAGERDGSHGW